MPPLRRLRLIIEGVIAMVAPKPSREEERRLRSQGYRLIAGVDEAGRGALMGPVVAAAVIMPEVISSGWQDMVRDSKQLSPKEREALYAYITEAAIAVGVAFSPPEVIDTVGIAKASRLAMAEAVRKLNPQPQYVLVDYFDLPEIPLPQRGITDGDALCFSIACASIIAKVSRDRMVIELDRKYPGYGFATNKGYGTREHLTCLARRGPCPVHRRSFYPVSKMTQR